MRKSKKILMSVICTVGTFVMAGSMTACAVGNDSTPQQQRETQQETAGAGDAQQNTDQPGQSSGMQTDNGQTDNGQINNEQISLDDAKNAALADAGVSAADVIYTKEKLDYEDGIAVYDIEFFAGSVEYGYEINAATGEVYSKSVETQQAQTGTGAGAEETYIEGERAIAAALSHAGFAEEDVSYLKCDFDMDDGQAVYEIEFYRDNREYEYTVNAVDGTVIEYKID